MLYLCTSITNFKEFFNTFKNLHKDVECIDLSKIPSENLADECSSILAHHKDCIVFIGYLEPGWMLSLQNQTRLRKVFRKFPVGIVTNFLESLPYSWKTELDTIYTFKGQN